MHSSGRCSRGVDRTKAVEEVVEPPPGHAAFGHKVGKAHPVDLNRAGRTEHEVGGGQGGIAVTSVNESRAVNKSRAKLGHEGSPRNTDSPELNLQRLVYTRTEFNAGVLLSTPMFPPAHNHALISKDETCISLFAACLSDGHRRHCLLSVFACPYERREKVRELGRNRSVKVQLPSEVLDRGRLGHEVVAGAGNPGGHRVSRECICMEFRKRHWRGGCDSADLFSRFIQCLARLHLHQAYCQSTFPSCWSTFSTIPIPPLHLFASSYHLRTC